MIALRATDVGKAYRLYQRPIDSLKELVFRRQLAETFWALRHVSLEVPIGGSLGIIGDNGAGKSTLLRVLAAAVPPTEGTVERHGRTSAMLSLGAGFHPDLSGRENIRIGCAMLGLSPTETTALTPAIIDFSELGEFIERPVRTYSSGMQLRLGFAVATAVEPEVLIVDEHLSVGDQHFRHKCMRRIQQLRESGCALVFCSHDLYAVREVCERTIWLHEGTVRLLTDSPTVIDAYQDHVRARDAAPDPMAQPATAAAATPTIREDLACHLREVALAAMDGESALISGGRLEVRILASISDTIRQEGVGLGLLIVRNDGVWCYGVSTGIDAVDPLVSLGEQRYGARFVIDPLPLLAGQYSFTVALMDVQRHHMYDTWTGAAPFTVTHAGRDVGLVRLEHHWVSP